MPTIRARLRALTFRNKRDKSGTSDEADTQKAAIAINYHQAPQLYYTPETPSVDSPHSRSVFSLDTPGLTSSLSASQLPLSIDDKVAAQSSDPPVDDDHTALSQAYTLFIEAFPQYRTTAELDQVRRLHYGRLEATGHVYLDYTGGSLYPSHLIDWHHDILSRGVFGNPHSDSPASRSSTTHEQAARQAVLTFLDADPDEYDVVFTPNATGGLKIVTENYPFAGKRLVIAMDAHNSVNGMACTARKAGGTVELVELEQEHLTVDAARMQETLRSEPDNSNPGLVFFTGQSNVTGAKAKSEWFSIARQNGWHIGLDASALAPTSHISMRQNPVDFLVISIYKIVGYPTGVGALVLRKEARRSLLVRKTFTGGTIDAVDPVTSDYRLYDSHSAFEDGTLNYLSLPAVVQGLQFIRPLLDPLSCRLAALTSYLWSQLSEIRFDDQLATPLVELRGPPPGPDRGATLPLVFHLPGQEGSVRLAPFKFIVWAAGRQNISVRGGPCLCNPGAASSVMRGVGFEDWEKTILSESGIIRISLGIASNFQDCYTFLQFCRRLATTSFFNEELTAWQAGSR